MTEDEQLSQECADLIEEAGRVLTIKKLSTTPQDSSAPWRASGPEYGDSHDVFGVVVGFSSREIDGEEIRVEDRKILIAASPLPTTELESYNVIFDGDKPYSIVKCRLVFPGTVRFIYIFQVRQ